MMAGNPNWWSMHPHPHFVFGTSNSNPSPPSDLHHDLPVRSWSHLLLGGLRGNEEESLFQQQKKLEDEELNLNPSFSTISVDVKQESIYGQLVDDQFQNQVSKSHHHPQSLFNFSSKDSKNHHHIQDHSSQGTRWERKNGGVTKKAKVQQSAQPALKVRKEKLGDRITALHQLVSPFGKTDTASVLSEAIGYIRFLQCQVETLSSSYMRNGAENTIHQQHSVQEKNCLCIQEPSQFLNDIAMEGTGASQQDSLGLSDLRSRGLCLVPISCTLHVGNDNGADYWAPAAFGGGISFSG